METIIIIRIDVDDKLLILFEITECDGFDGMKDDFPPNDVFILKIDDFREDCFDKVFTFDDVIDCMISQKEYSGLTLIIFIIFFNPTGINDFFIRV